MTPQSLQPTPKGVWEVARRQHGVVVRRQLVELGLGKEAILHRVRSGRLHAIWPGVYAVGRPEVTQPGVWMAAVLSCGRGALLSHTSAAELWGIRPPSKGWPEVSIPANRSIGRRDRMRIHRRAALDAASATRRLAIPVTSPALTLVDLAPRLTQSQLERAVNEADRLELLDPESLREDLASVGRRHGIAVLRRLLDSRTFLLTDSELERRFLPLARSAGLPLPQTGARVSGYKVDFFWPNLGLVVETDGLRYHRTPAQQAADRRRDQAHTARGLTPLRFTHGQVVSDPEWVRATLAAVAERPAVGFRSTAKPSQ